MNVGTRLRRPRHSVNRILKPLSIQPSPSGGTPASDTRTRASLRRIWAPRSSVRQRPLGRELVDLDHRRVLGAAAVGISGGLHLCGEASDEAAARVDEFPGAAVDLGGLLGSWRSEMQLRGSTEGFEVDARADQVHAPVGEHEVVPQHVVRIARLARGPRRYDRRRGTRPWRGATLASTVRSPERRPCDDRAVKRLIPPRLRRRRRRDAAKLPAASSAPRVALPFPVILSSCLPRGSVTDDTGSPARTHCEPQDTRDTCATRDAGDACDASTPAMPALLVMLVLVVAMP